MNSIDIDILNSLQTVTQCYNDLISKYNKLETKYFGIQMNLCLIRSNVLDLKFKDEKELEIINRINELIRQSIDSAYIKGDSNE